MYHFCRALQSPLIAAPEAAKNGHIEPSHKMMEKLNNKPKYKKRQSDGRNQKDASHRISHQVYYEIYKFFCYHNCSYELFGLS
jgi:hypothetical protein